ncbi:MAG: glycosyltransferase [Desulfotomaculum sp.]|nr:glycosyltransferase [Desulfotomaculum sp.]
MTCTISLCMIAKNEEKQIERCIKSAQPYVDQIVVVDTGSTDKTKDTAKKLGAEVYDFKWADDFSQARNESLKHAAGDWILFLDCDEKLDQKTAPELKKIINDDRYDGYWLQFLNYFNGNPSTSFLSFRLFRNNPNYRFQCPIHEQILPSVLRYSSPERIGQAKVKVFHYGYEDSEVVNKNKIQRNIRILQKAKKEYGNAGFINFYLGVEYQRLGNYQKALEHYKEALEQSSITETYTPALVRAAAYCLLSLKRYQEGINFIDKYLTYYPDYTDLVYLKGTLQYKLNNYSEALNCMNQCLAMGPPPVKYYSLLGIADERPKEFIKNIVEKLLFYSMELINKGHYSHSFSVLNTAAQQLKKTPDEKYYLMLVSAMHSLLVSVMSSFK